jgi:hypothetical protein
VLGLRLWSEAVLGVGCEEGFGGYSEHVSESSRGRVSRVDEERLHFGVWIRFDSAGRLELGLARQLRRW